MSHLHNRASVRASAIALVAVFAVLLAPELFASSTITIVNNDRRREGFNDTTPVAPVGGNPGTTLGEQRLIVFQTAADIWGSILNSAAEIRVAATFDSLSCNASSAVLGSAGAVQVAANFPNAPIADTWYPVALANALAGQDLSPQNDDIAAQFNSSIDNNDNCLAGTNWYLGLDNNGGTDIDLLVVVLHELGHGLGFANFVNDSTGALLNGQADIYTVFSLDETLGLHWNEMSNAQRAGSAINTGNLVWEGPNVTAEAPNVLDPQATVDVNSPAGIASERFAQPATFGATVGSPDITGDVVLVDDGNGVTTDGCEPLVNGAAVSGNIALVDRGTCSFAEKAVNAQTAGAIGVIVANNVAPGLPPMGGDDPTVTIVNVGISQADGNSIKANLPGVNVTIGLSATLLAGANASGFVRLYAPNPVEPGSSVSHWDVTATPNLLMEPAFNADLSSDVDLTDELMQDIGWTLMVPTVCGNGVREPGEECDGTDFGGATCGDFGCNMGMLSCTAMCLIDTSGCFDCGPVCGNNMCEPGTGSQNEDCMSCPQDCAGQLTGNPNNRFCCGNGILESAEGNGDICDNHF